MNDRPSTPAPFRMPDGPPPGTSARGTLGAATADPTPESVHDDTLVATEEARDDHPPLNERWPEDEWANLESADGRPIESPYHDETALHHALVSEDMRNSGAYDYPLDDEQDVYAPATTVTTVSLDKPGDGILATSADDGGVPPTIPSSQVLEEHDENAPANDREMELVDHLRELRTRILNCVWAITIAMVATWNYAPQITEAIIKPAKTAMLNAGVKGGGEIVLLAPTEGFMLQFNISLISALIATAPWTLFQVWKFIEPAMTKRERKFTGLMVPFSSLLFFAGCTLGYVMSPLFFAFFAMFVAPGVVANWSLASTAELLAKMLLVCGICFQVPVFTILLNKSGVVERNTLIEYWRHVVVGIFIVVSILTPTWDPVSLMVCALPPCFLYALSIWLVKWLP